MSRSSMYLRVPYVTSTLPLGQHLLPLLVLQQLQGQRLEKEALLTGLLFADIDLHDYLK